MEGAQFVIGWIDNGDVRVDHLKVRRLSGNGFVRLAPVSTQAPLRGQV